MKRPLLLASLLAAVLAIVAVAFSYPRTPQPGEGVETVRAGAVEPPETVLRPGDRAPDFAYEAPDGSSLHLHDVLTQGHVLLVFQPSSDQMTELERERQALQTRGVMVVAVLDRGTRSTWAMARRLGVHYLVIPDPRAVIGAQFNVLGANTRRPDPAWFAIDRGGKIRALERAHVPDSDFTTLATDALSLPAPDAMAPSSAH